MEIRLSKITLIISFLLLQTNLQAQRGQEHLKHLFGGTTSQQTTPNYQRMNCSSNPASLGHRSIDGSCNNLNITDLGAAISPVSTLGAAAYSANCGMIDRGNPRAISNLLFNQTTSVPDENNLSAFVYTWLQFIDHDITLQPTDNVAANIPVPQGDPFFDPLGTGIQVIPFNRSANAPTGNCAQLNNLTAWLDGSNVYGNSPAREAWLRTTNGKLKTSPSPNGDLLPCNTVDGNCANAIDPSAPDMDGSNGNSLKVFVAGDFRANEQPGLTALHTLFVREHNRICDILLAQGFTNSDQIYLYAKRIVGAEIQAITYNEILPALGIQLNAYNGYDDTVDPTIFSEFSAGAYRLGHTMVAASIPLTDANCNPQTITIDCTAQLTGACPATYTGEIQLRDAFFNPSLVEAAGIEPILNGLRTQTQEAVDRFVIDDLRNFLFGPPGAGGLDLASLNLQRGRDHGLSDYNTMRQSFNLPPVGSFNDISSDGATINALAATYTDVNSMDAWAGMLAEDHLPEASVGPTIHAILKKQFENIRDGDRFWHQVDPGLTPGDRNQLGNTRLDDIIRNNTAINTGNASLAFSTTCAPPSDYCIPDYAVIESHCYTYIDQVSINEISNNTTATTTTGGGYSDHTNLTTKLIPGENYTLSVRLASCNTSADTHLGIWIDWNGNGIFDVPTEQIEAGSYWYGGGNTNPNPYTRTYQITVPQDAYIGPIRLRIRTDFHASVNYGPCTAYDNVTAAGTYYNNRGGETEDYTLNICGDYCVPTYWENNCRAYISGVNIGDIDNIPTNESAYAGSYQYYKNLCTELTQGESATITIDLETCTKAGPAGTGEDVDLGIWIDWNGDMTFDPSELVYDSNINSPLGYEWINFYGENSVTFTFPIPSDALPGTSRMRIRTSTDWDNTTTPSIDPCAEYEAGETEDYCIQITPTYCEPTYDNSSCEGYISGVTLNGYINFPTDASETMGGFGTYLDTCVNLVVGADYQLRAYLSSCWVDGNDADLGVWIDWNQNGLFDPAELLYDSNTDSPDTYEWMDYNQNEEIFIDFQVPTDAILGKTRLRLRSNSDSLVLSDDPQIVTVDPCINFSGGETEDYYINVVNCVTEIAAIVGDTLVPENSTDILYYVAESDADATYNWSVPFGSTITSGQGNDSITVDWATAGGLVSVIKTKPECSTTSTYLPVIIEEGSGPVICTADTCALSGAMIDIPVTLANFNMIEAFQFGITWDPTVISYTGFGDFGLPFALGVNAMGSDTGFVQTSWFDLLGDSHTLPDGDTLFVLHFEVIGNPGDMTQIEISNSFRPIVFTMNGTSFSNVVVNFGSVCISNSMNLGGTMSTPTGDPTAARVSLLNEDTGAELITDTDPINFSWNGLTEGNDYLLTPFDDVLNVSFDVTDMVKLNREILGTEPFVSPYQYIAADVNDDDMVNVTDIILINRLILGTNDSFPSGLVKRFVSTATPPTLANPFTFDEFISINDLQNSVYGVDFIAVRLGEITDAATALGPVLRQMPVGLEMPDQEASKGETIQVPISVRDFKQVTGLQFSIEWDSKVLEFVGHQANTSIAITENDMNLKHLADGKLALLWFDPLSMGATLEDDDILLNLEFKAIGKAGETSSIAINSTLIPSKLVGPNLGTLEQEVQEGNVRITSPTGIATIDEIPLQIHPNPLSDRATISFELNATTEVEMTVYNTLGQTVWSYQATRNEGLQSIDFDASVLPAGAYYLRLKTGEDIATRELIIQ